MEGGGSRWEFAAREEPNLAARESMQDFTLAEPDLLRDGSTAFFAVLDGHGTADAARAARDACADALRRALGRFAPAEALRQTVAMLDAQLRMRGARRCGTTLCGLLLRRGEGRLFAVNVGDSRAARLHPPAFLTAEHNAAVPAEAQRVRDRGGNVCNGRVGGSLQVSRALGDFELRAAGLTAEPDVADWPLSPGAYLLASDGLWSVLGLEAVCEAVSGRDAASAAETLLQAALRARSTDNISLILVNVQR